MKPLADLQTWRALFPNAFRHCEHSFLERNMKPVPTSWIRMQQPQNVLQVVETSFGAAFQPRYSLENRATGSIISRHVSVEQPVR